MEVGRKSVAELIQSRFGTGTTTIVNRELSSIGVAAVTVFRQNPNRAALLLVNLSANDVYVSPRGTPSATHGVRLGPNGGSLALDFKEDFELPTYEWQGIATAAASAVFCLETLTA